MCNIGDIILVESYKHKRHSLTRHSFVVLSNLFVIMILTSACTKIHLSHNDSNRPSEIEYIIQIFNDWDNYMIENYGTLSLEWGDGYLYYISKVRQAFKDDPALFVEAVNISGRNGRLAVIRITSGGCLSLGLYHMLAWVACDGNCDLCTDWLISLTCSLLEDNPTVDYIGQLFHDAFYFGHSPQSPSHNLFMSRIWHSFESNVGAFLEASSIYNSYWGLEDDDIHWLIEEIPRNISAAKFMRHFMFYSDWMNLLEYASNLELSNGAEQILDAIHANIYRFLNERLQSRLWLETVDGYHLLEMQGHRDTLRPNVEWVDDFDWISRKRSNSMITDASRIFDPRTKETFEMIQILLAEHSLI